jgi:hypothetical protein
MGHRELQARVEARDDALLIDMDRKSELADKAHDEALLVAAQIVKDPARLIGFVKRGDLMLHEITFHDPFANEVKDLETALCELISHAAKMRQNDLLGKIGGALIDHLAESPDVQDEATRLAYAGMADEQADRNDWERY